MTDCNDINKRLDDYEAEEKRLNELEAKLNAERESILGKGTTKGVKRTLKDFEGNDMTINSKDYWEQVEKDNIARGGDDIQNLVKEGFTKDIKPKGSTGSMINYGQIPPTEKNLAALLEVLGLKRTQTTKGIELKRPFTQQQASQAAISIARTHGGNPVALGQMLARNFKGIDHLPVDVYTAARFRRETSAAYADALDEIAELIEIGGVTPQKQGELANIGKWAHFFEQIDAQARRKLGQAFKSLQMDAGAEGIRLLDLEKDIAALTWDDVTGGSLLAQVAEHIAKGDVQKLKEIARAKRLGGLLDAPVNRSEFWTQFHIMNQYRKDGLFIAFGSWAIRNPSSIAISFWYGANDIVEGALRVGVRDELKAFGYASRAALSAQSVAFKNASDAFTQGIARMGGRNVKEISPQILQENKAFVESTLDKSYDLVFGENRTSNPATFGLALNNLIDASWRNVLGNAVERASAKAGIKEPVTAGYMPSFRLLNYFDEWLRTTSFTWKTKHEAALRSLQEADDLVKNKILDRKDVDQFVMQNSEELTENAVFNGKMSDDDLIKLRREIGVNLGDNMDNETLRLKMFNDLNGVPNLNDEFGKMGKVRGDDVTFTKQRKDPFNVGVSIARKNPAVEFVLPVWRVLSNSFIWGLKADFHANLAKLLIDEVRARKGSVSAADLRQQRAATIVATGMMGSAYALWQMGILKGGLSFNKEERDRRIANGEIPYSINGFGLSSSGKGVDFVDSLTTNLDVFQAHHEGLIDTPNLSEWLLKVGQAYVRQITNKMGMYQIINAGNLLNSEGERGNAIKFFANASNGVMPLGPTGLLGNVARGFRDPSEKVVLRRFLSAEELRALEKDEIYITLAPIINGLRQFAEQSNKNVPIMNQIFKAPTINKDWKWQKIERPLGLPLDNATPFMPIVRPKDPLYEWEAKHGFGMKPRPNYQVAKLTMTNDEEYIYREHMGTVVGERPAYDVLGPKSITNPVGSIDKYVLGNTLIDALRKLSTDFEYNQQLKQSDNSPSLTAPHNRNKTIGERTQGFAKEGAMDLYKPYDVIVSYYDKLGILHMYNNSPTFKKRYDAMIDERDRRIQLFIEQETSLGVGRQ